MTALKKNVFYVMGVSGCGKSTVGKLLAKAFTIPFFDGDDYHPQSNIDKMKEGNPLTDEDRYAWLVALNQLGKEHSTKGVVIACSALKEQYRELLSKGIEQQTSWIFLAGSYEEIELRMRARKGHFMPAALLKSQFETLEVPDKAIAVSIALSPKEIVKEIEKELSKN